MLDNRIRIRVGHDSWNRPIPSHFVPRCCNFGSESRNPGSHSIRGPTSDPIKHIVEYPYNRKPLQTEAKASLNRSARNQNEEEKMHPRSSTPVHHSPHIVETLSPSVIQRYNTPGPKGEQPWILVTGASDGIGKE